MWEGICMDITYFESPGEQNTERVLDIVKKRCEDLGITYVLVPSVRGVSAEKALDKFENTEITLFFVGIDPAKFSTDTRTRIERSGFKLVFYKQVSYAYPDEAKNAFRRFGQGTKVAVELALIAAHEEVVPTDMEVVSLGGTGKGHDTALVILPAKSDNFNDLEVREVLCKPRRIKIN
jgi:hypothetical protein